MLWLAVLTSFTAAVRREMKKIYTEKKLMACFKKNLPLDIREVSKIICSFDATWVDN